MTTIIVYMFLSNAPDRYDDFMTSARILQYLGFENVLSSSCIHLFFGNSSFRLLWIKTPSFFILINKYMCLDLHRSTQPG